LPYNRHPGNHTESWNTLRPAPLFPYYLCSLFLSTAGTLILVKFDGSYWRWIPYGKTWFLDQTLTKEDYYNGHLRNLPKEEVEKILNY
jgi:hypothetical protein